MQSWPKILQNNSEGGNGSPFFWLINCKHDQKYYKIIVKFLDGASVSTIIEEIILRKKGMVPPFLLVFKDFTK